MMRVLKFLVSAACLAVLSSAALAQDRPRIVTVNYALHYLTERLVGEGAEVMFPVPADVDPSFWRPSIADISAIQSADLIVLNGAGFATWVDRVSLPRSRIVNSAAQISGQFIVTESITHSHGDGGEHSHEGLASYTWLDPMLALAQAETIAAALVTRGLVAEQNVTPQLAALRADLEMLQIRGAEVFADFQGMPLITTHPRYPYLARQFGITVAALEWEAGATPTADQLEDLKALISETGARVLIWEQAPEPAATDATAALGVANVTFPTLAHIPATGSYLEAYEAALSELEDIGDRLTSN